MRTPTTDLLRVEFDIYPNYDHSEFQARNACSEDFSDCEGDCSRCPNMGFFVLAGQAKRRITRSEIAVLLREKADYMERLAERYGDEIRPLC